MTEFKQIPQALKYEMDDEGSIQTIAKQSPIIPFPIGGRVVILEANDGSRKSFNVDKLIADIFNAEASVPSQATAEETSAPIEIEPEKVFIDGVPLLKIIASDSEKIMALDTFVSVKIWKLHQLGLSNDDICEIVKYPHSANVPTTIKNYKKSEKQRAKADKIKV